MSETTENFIGYTSIFIAFICVFCVPLGIIFWNIKKHKKADYKDANLICMFAVFFLIILNINKIQVFKLWGLEAQLRDTIASATATISDLRKTALAVSAPIYSQLALSGLLFFTNTFSDRYKNKSDLDASLKSIGASQDEINKARRNWDLFVAYGLGSMIVRGEKFENVLNGDQTKAWNKLACEYFEDNQKIIPPEKVQEFLDKNSLSSSRALERLENYKAFLKTGEVKHPEEWPGGYVGFPSDCDHK